jgi:hypothetical protein
LRVRSPLLAQSLNCFLFLQVLRCFSSLSLLPALQQNNAPSVHWVAPFGNLRINSYLRIPVAYRSLSRPSSPLRAKAFPIRPSLLLLTNSLSPPPRPFADRGFIGIFLCARLINCTCQRSLLNTPTTSTHHFTMMRLKLLLLLFLQYVNELLCTPLLPWVNFEWLLSIPPQGATM